MVTLSMLDSTFSEQIRRRFQLYRTSLHLMIAWNNVKLACPHSCKNKILCCFPSKQTMGPNAIYIVIQGNVNSNQSMYVSIQLKSGKSNLESHQNSWKTGKETINAKLVCHLISAYMVPPMSWHLTYLSFSSSVADSRVIPWNLSSLKTEHPGFPGGAVVKNPPASAGNTGSSPGPGRSHMRRSN